MKRFLLTSLACLNLASALHAAPGNVDLTFDPGSVDGNVYCLATQTDGKVIIGGRFESVGGISRNGIARLNSDGILDHTFNPGTGTSNVYAVAVQADGKVLVGGDFISLNGTNWNRIARLNANGSRDATFSTGIGGTGANGAVYAIAVQPDGKVLLGGNFTTISGIPINYIARLQTNGNPDSTFDVGSGADNPVYSLALKTDGKVLAGGSFTSFGNSPRIRIVQLNTNGFVDPGFNPDSGANETIWAVISQPDGKAIIGGNFTEVNGTNRSRIARLNANGSLDLTLDPGTGADDLIFSLALQSDGKVLIGGAFTTFDGTERRHLARLNADGSLDTTFNPGSGATGVNSAIYAVVAQANGKALVAGEFDDFKGVARDSVARLWSDSFGVSEVPAQVWHSTDSMPLFRGTVAQAVALEKKVQSTLCLSNLRSLGIAGRLYGNDTGIFPSNWQQFTNEINLPVRLYCPADSAHPLQTNWADVNFTSISYQIISPGASDSELDRVFIQCTVHQNYVSVDGSSHEVAAYETDIIGSRTNGGLVLPTPFLNAARDRAFKISCISNVKQIGLAARLYSINGEPYPSSFSQMTNELGHPKVLFCPANITNVAPTTFAQVNYTNVDYVILGPGTSEDEDPPIAYVKCRLHGNRVETDGAAYPGTNIYPRIILGHPLSQTVEPGGTVTLSVLVRSEPDLPPFRFQWRKKQPFDAFGNPFTNDVVIVGATNASLVFTNAQAMNESYYDVIVHDANGDYQESYMAYLRVEPLDAIKTNSWETYCCLNNLKGIQIACRLYANDLIIYPTNLSQLPNLLSWPLTLYCPSDASRTPPASWNLVDFNNTSYQFNVITDPEASTNILAVCKAHGFTIPVDELSIRPPGAKILIPSSGKTVITWTNAATALQSAPFITGPFTNIPNATSPYTNSITGPQQYFRLKGN